MTGPSLTESDRVGEGDRLGLPRSMSRQRNASRESPWVKAPRSVAASSKKVAAATAEPASGDNPAQILRPGGTCRSGALPPLRAGLWSSGYGFGEQIQTFGVSIDRVEHPVM